MYFIAKKLGDCGQKLYREEDIFEVSFLFQLQASTLSVS